MYDFAGKESASNTFPNSIVQKLDNDEDERCA